MFVSAKTKLVSQKIAISCRTPLNTAHATRSVSLRSYYVRTNPEQAHVADSHLTGADRGAINVPSASPALRDATCLLPTNGQLNVALSLSPNEHPSQ